MLSYEFYKVAHLSMIFLFISQMAVSLLADGYDKKAKILSGVATLLILVAGMGLIARLGFDHGAGWPAWVKAKIAIWVLVSALGPIAAKRFGKAKVLSFYVVLILCICAAYIAVNKPW